MSDNDYNKYGGNRNRRRRRKSKKEKMGFYLAFAICLVAVGMAVFSTYTGLTNYLIDDEKISETSYDATKPVDNIVTGVTEVPKDDSEETTSPRIIISETPPTAAATEPAATETTEDALQTMLSVSDSLSSPLDDFVISKEYSENAVYNKTLNDWRAHTGIDLKADTGDDVYSMGDGTVENVYSDNFLGNVVTVKKDSYVVYYCGLSKNIPIQKGQSVKSGDVIGNVGTVPFEAMDDSHIHIEVKVKDKYIDPLSVIKNNE